MEQTQNIYVNPLTVATVQLLSAFDRAWITVNGTKVVTDIDGANLIIAEIESLVDTLKSRPSEKDSN